MAQVRQILEHLSRPLKDKTQAARSCLGTPLSPYHQFLNPIQAATTSQTPTSKRTPDRRWTALTLLAAKQPKKRRCTVMLAPCVAAPDRYFPAANRCNSSCAAPRDRTPLWSAARCWNPIPPTLCPLGSAVMHFAAEAGGSSGLPAREERHCRHCSYLPLAAPAGDGIHATLKS